MKRGGRTRAARTGALHREVDHALPEAAEGDIATIAGNRGADAGFQQFLDCRDRLGILRREELLAGNFRGRIGGDHRRAGEIMFHDRAENRGLEVLPFAASLRHRHEIGPEKHAGNPGNAE